MCEDFVHVANTIGKLQQYKYLKQLFLETFKLAIRLVLPDPVTYNVD